MVSFTTNRHRNLCWRVHLLSPSWRAIFCLVLHAVTMHLQTVDAAQPSTILEALPHINSTQAAEITPLTAMEWSRLLLHHVICSQRAPFCCCRGWRECTAHFLSLVTLTFETNITTRPSEGPNTSSVLIWHTNTFSGSHAIHNAPFESDDLQMTYSKHGDAGKRLGTTMDNV